MGVIPDFPSQTLSKGEGIWPIRAPLKPPLVLFLNSSQDREAEPAPPTPTPALVCLLPETSGLPSIPSLLASEPAVFFGLRLDLLSFLMSISQLSKPHRSWELAQGHSVEQRASLL